jgi:hypothetical protein
MSSDALPAEVAAAYRALALGSAFLWSDAKRIAERPDEAERSEQRRRAIVAHGMRREAMERRGEKRASLLAASERVLNPDRARLLREAEAHVRNRPRARWETF